MFEKLLELMQSRTGKLVFIVFSFAYAFLFGFLFVNKSRDIEVRQKDTTEALSREIQTLKVGSVLGSREKLRSELLRAPFNRQYLFLDSKQIEDQYAKLGPQAIVTAADVELTSNLERSGSIAFREFLKTQIGEDTVKKVKERFEVVNKVPSAKYEELEAYGIRKDYVTFGVEKLDVAAPKAEAFDSAVHDLQQKFDFKLDPSKVTEAKRRLAEEVAPQFVEMLNKGPKSVLVQGDFSITMSRDGNVATFAFDHPLNRRFLLRKKIEFVFQLPVTEVAEYWRSRVQRSPTLPIGVMGTLVLEPSESEYRLEIVPLAVYIQ